MQKNYIFILQFNLGHSVAGTHQEHVILEDVCHDQDHHILFQSHLLSKTIKNKVYTVYPLRHHR